MADKRKATRDTITVMLNVPKRFLVDQFISACEGGSNYWCEKVTPLGRKGDAYEQMLGGFRIWERMEQPVAPSRRITVNVPEIHKAVILMAEKYPAQFGAMIAENGDATTADIFLQLCTFGEVKYG